MTLPERRLNEPPTDPREVKCPACKGKGTVPVTNGFYDDEYASCPTCGGAGYIIDDEPD